MHVMARDVEVVILKTTQHSQRTNMEQVRTEIRLAVQKYEKKGSTSRRERRGHKGKQNERERENERENEQSKRYQ